LNENQYAEFLVGEYNVRACLCRQPCVWPSGYEAKIGGIIELVLDWHY